MCRTLALFLMLFFFGLSGAVAKPTTQPSSRLYSVPHRSVQQARTKCHTRSSASTHVQWAALSFEQALNKARTTRCPILLDMYATWCYPCKKYDRLVFNRSEVSQFVHTHFIPLRRDGMKGEGKVLKKRYNCVTFPCIVVIDPKGQEIDRVTRFMRSSSFMYRLKQIRQGKATLASLLPQLAQRPQDAVLHFRVGLRLAYRGDARSIRHLMFVAQHPPKGYPWLAPRSLYILGRIYYRNSKRDYVSALRVFNMYLQRFPKARKALRVRRLKAWCERRIAMRR